MRTGRASLIGLLVSLFLIAACSPPRPRQIILISIDSLRVDHLGVYGYERDTSPHIDAIAAEGLVFDRVISSTSRTLPAHVALFAGLGDSLHGVVNGGLALGAGPTTLAERMRDLGYATGAVVSGPYLHRGFGLDRGFDEYLSCMGFLDESFQPMHQESIGLRQLHDESHLDVTSPCVAERAASWIREHRDERAFLFLHFWDVHFDYLPPKDFLERFDPGYEGSLDASDFELNDSISIDMAARDLHYLEALYDAEIAYVDEHIGQVMVDRLTGRIEVFDLAMDPLEQRPLPPSDEILKRLEGHFRALERIGSPPPELEEKLRSLGYIE